MPLSRSPMKHKIITFAHFVDQGWQQRSLQHINFNHLLTLEYSGILENSSLPVIGMDYCRFSESSYSRFSLNFLANHRVHSGISSPKMHHLSNPDVMMRQTFTVGRKTFIWGDILQVPWNEQQLFCQATSFQTLWCAFSGFGFVLQK